ncbi:LytR/AlgR family response regulator transcription factor [Flagellimonas sp. S174]|uniref:LytR/AlgR family response regulator transcription factor n=1 Tax=Flagellimonas sp. S174 TaxID=3410790 RepID=UPI003BF54575
MGLRCIVIEDQLHAQKVLQKHIDNVPHMELEGVFTNAPEALAVLNNKKIDVIFLDIDLPQINGIDFLKSIPQDSFTIITTAYSEYAIEGFNLTVTDYLLKPISFERFLQAISKVNEKKTYIKSATVPEDAFLFAKDGHTIIKIYLKTIKVIKADNDFTLLFLEEKKLLLSYSLKFWQETLPQMNFFRCHKSYIVNIDKISKIIGNTIYIDKDRIPIGRTNKEALLKKINPL